MGELQHLEDEARNGKVVPLIPECFGRWVRFSSLTPEQVMDIVSEDKNEYMRGLRLITSTSVKNAQQHSPLWVVVLTLQQAGDFDPDELTDINGRISELQNGELRFSGLKVRVTYCQFFEKILDNQEEIASMTRHMTQSAATRHMIRATLQAQLQFRKSKLRVWEMTAEELGPQVPIHLALVPCFWQPDTNDQWQMAVCVYFNQQYPQSLLRSKVWLNHVALYHVGAICSLVTEDGEVVAQNPASMAFLGFRAKEHFCNPEEAPKGSFWEELFVEEDKKRRKDHKAAMLAAVRAGQTWQCRIAIPPSVSQSSAYSPRDVYHDVIVSRQPNAPRPDMLLLSVTQIDATREVGMRKRETQLLKEILPEHVLELLLEQETERRAGSGDGVAEDRHRSSSELSLGLLSNMDMTKTANYHSQVTIFFSDIKGFTAMSQQLDPADVMMFLNDLYTRFDTLSEVYNVYKVETIGDAYMVAGGLSYHDDMQGMCVAACTRPAAGHAQRVLDFAKAVVQVAREVSMPGSDEHVQLRVGIHSGPVVSGVVGTRMPRFCLFGDTVNTASRMESTGTAGRIHVSESTRALLPHEKWNATGGVEVKGKGQMDTFLLCVE